MPLDKDNRVLFERVMAARGEPLYKLPVAVARAAYGRLGGLCPAGPAMLRVLDLEMPTREGAIRLRVLIPCERVRGIIVYYHGGGWVLGSIDEFDAVARKLAQRSGCAVCMVDYRLAPEHPFPAAVDDAYAAVAWISDNAKALVGTDVPIVVAGDSAGGNLAAVITQRACARSGPPIALQVLVYPVTQPDCDGSSYHDPDRQVLLTRESMRWFWEQYVPNAADRSHHEVSPLYAESLRGLPPALVITAECDPLREEGEEYAARLEKDGVPVRLRRFAGQMHGFFQLVEVLPMSALAIDEIVAAIDSTLPRQRIG